MAYYATKQSMASNPFSDPKSLIISASVRTRQNKRQGVHLIGRFGHDVRVEYMCPVLKSESVRWSPQIILVLHISISDQSTCHLQRLFSLLEKKKRGASHQRPGIVFQEPQTISRRSILACTSSTVDDVKLELPRRLQLPGSQNAAGQHGSDRRSD